MPYIPEEQLKQIMDKISTLEKWKEDTIRKLSFLDKITIEGHGKITFSGGHLKVNNNSDTISMSKKS